MMNTLELTEKKEEKSMKFKKHLNQNLDLMKEELNKVKDKKYDRKNSLVLTKKSLIS